MKENKIRTLYELKDSCILYEKKMPAFGYMLLWGVTALLIAAIVWSIHTPKVDVIRAQGIVESRNKQYVMTQYGGQLLSIHAQEGVYVHAGDLLFEIQGTDWYAPVESFTVTAPADGIVHLNGDFQTGMMVQAAAALATILTVEDDLLVTAYIPSADRVRIQEGDSVDIAVSGLPQSDYGTVRGIVETIDADATAVDGTEGGLYFRVTVRLEETVLSCQSGDTIALYDGMTAEIRIRYDEISYFDYLLGAFGLRV